MKFNTDEIKLNKADLCRKLGYTPKSRNKGEFSAIKRLKSRDYPRFHLFIEENEDQLLFKLHLDQKRPSYEGSNAHSGEYESELVQEEKERIEKIIKDL